MKTAQKILGLFTYLLLCIAVEAQSLHFHKDGTFKVVQFTDLHWDNSSPKCAETLRTMRIVLAREKPDFVVFTGDIVTTEPVKEGWLRVCKPVAEEKIPWTVAFGNHDEEMNMEKEAIYKLLKEQPYFIGEKGIASGVGNFALPLYASDGSNKIKNTLYFFDSHDYTHNPKLGNYDWIKFDQIDWYRKHSNNLKANNNGISVPSLAFFHIPLLEYREVADSDNLLGEKQEGVASAEINSGLFAAMVEQKDMMGVFVGHDHDNNYIGITRNIALAFGQVTGSDAYGELERGARVIELREGRFAFHSWIRTPSVRKHDFYYPSGLSTITDSTKVLEASEVNPTQQGVKYCYYEYDEKIKTVDAITSLPLVKKGILPNISIASAQKKDYFAFTYTSWLKIPETGYYQFYSYSDDGAKLFIDGKLVVDNDGGHSARRKEGTVALAKGFHKLEVKYFESYMGNTLEVGMSSINLPEAPISDDVLFIME